MRLRIAPKDLQLEEVRKLQTNEVARRFNISVDALGDLEDSRDTFYPLRAR
jgi:hypothetical protein